MGRDRPGSSHLGVMHCVTSTLGSASGQLRNDGKIKVEGKARATRYAVAGRA